MRRNHIKLVVSPINLMEIKQVTASRARISKVAVLILIASLVSSLEVQAWSPGGGEESRLFNQLVTEQLKFIPQTPIKNRWGKTVGWRGPTYQQQWNWEYNRQIARANDAARDRNATIQDSSRQMRRLEGSLANDQRISDLRVKRQNAQQRVNIAQTLQPDGPTRTEVNARLGQTLTAGGQLDADKNGVISESEMKAALAGRVSMQRTQYLNEKKLDADGDNELGKSEWQQGLMEVAGVRSLDHNQLLEEARQDPSFRDTKIGQGTYVDAYGKVKSNQSLNNQTALKAELAKYTAERNVAANSRDNDRMTARKLRNGDLPTTTHRHASIRTTGTWGRTRSWNGSWDAGGGINRSQIQIQNQMGNAQAHGRNNSFYNRAQASTSGLRGANTQASANLANAQRTQNQTSGFRNAQAEVNRTLNSIR